MNDEDQEMQCTDVPLEPPREIVPAMNLKITDDYNLTLQEISRNFPETDNHYVRGYIRIYPNSSEVRTKIIEYLDKNEKEYVLSEAPTERPIKIVIKGVPPDHCREKITQELESLNFKVIRINHLRNYRLKTLHPIVLVELAKTPNVEEIFKINKVNLLKVTIEAYRKKQRATTAQTFIIAQGIPRPDWLHGKLQNPFQSSGGTAIFVKNNIPHHEIIPPTLHYVEATVVALDLNNSEKITLTSIYVPHSSDPGMFTFDIENLIQVSRNQIICGDYNAHHISWGCASTNHRGATLMNFVNSAGLEILAPSTPTRFGTNSASTIDLAIVREFLYPYDIISLPELSSDHNPILLNFYFKFSIPSINGKTKTNWNKFRNHINLDEKLNNLVINSPNDLNLLVEKFETQIIDAKIAASNPVSNSQTYIDPRIRELNNERNFVRKMFQRLRNPALKTKLNQLNKRINKLNDKIEDENYLDTLINVNTEDGTFWNFSRSFKRKKNNIPTLKGPASIAQTNSEKANCLADSLENQFKLNDLQHTETEAIVGNSVNCFLNTTPNHFNNFPPTSNEELINCIKKLKKNKAPGYDGINNKIILNLPHSSITTLKIITDNIMKFGYFPTRWKTATIIPILKPGKDPTDPVSYRPISLLPSISKIAEHIILSRLNDCLEENNILIPEQFGFRKKLSTTHQLLRVTEYIQEGLNNKLKTGAVFLDIQKAFDRVWQDGLIHKLINYNIPPYLIKIFHSYLTNRNFAVRVENELSHTKFIKAGVAQGSKIGPVLFALFINDMPKQFNTILSIFADDTAILARNKNHNYIQIALNRHLKTLEDWFTKWKIQINAGKTEAIMFTNSLNYPLPIKINNQIIPWSQECKYLGVILDKRLTWKPHFLYIKKKFRELTRKFYPLIARNSKMTRNNKLLIYTAYLRPVLSYACPVWGYAAKSNIKLLEKEQNLLIRNICHAKWYFLNRDIYNTINYPSLKTFIKKLSVNFFNSLDNHSNEAVRNIPVYTPTLNIKRPRNVLI
ncbi:RNA-directed DNA polymerase from mobile element jockey [Araneus ventricosus]|uniref:RNA-directed DNA polymerase from mobile element jockey n=1 Tax=Araneus ventricosus TaxID=182803 RepID=A0A4Y2IZX8_ARAVE|nr:RNA-directed DNA polymerase from mobile element jockey [Araneus ventricosus]